MVYIIAEVLVTIAEYADSQSIYTLMLTCRRFRDILQYHERSVVKSRLDAYCRSAVDPRVFSHAEIANDHPILRLYGDNDGTVLSSDSSRRAVARPYSYAVVKELEVREGRTSEVLDYYTSAVNINGDTNNDGLLRACRVADLIGDCVARIVARAGWVEGYNAHLTDDHDSSHASCRCPCNYWGYALTAPLSLDTTGSWNNHRPGDGPLSPIQPRRQADYDTNNAMLKLAVAVREAQLAVVKGLSQWDLAYLSLLTETAGATFSGSLPERARLSDPDHLEKRTAFQESVLRRGASLSMWAACGDWTCALDKKPGGAPRSRCTSQVHRVLGLIREELLLWETGYGADMVTVGEAFPRVENKKLASVMDALDRELDGRTGEDRVGEDGEDAADDDSEERNIPAMRPGLQMTTVRSLCRKADLKCLRESEKEYVKLMMPWDHTSG